MIAVMVAAAGFMMLMGLLALAGVLMTAPFWAGITLLAVAAVAYRICKDVDREVRAEQAYVRRRRRHLESAAGIGYGPDPGVEER